MTQHAPALDDADHDRAAVLMETTFIRDVKPVYGTLMINRALRFAWRNAIAYVLRRQAGWHTDLTDRERIIELRKGPGSIYHPIFDDGTGEPTIWADCIACGRAVTDKTGRCHTCDLNLMEKS